MHFYQFEDYLISGINETNQVLKVQRSDEFKVKNFKGFSLESWESTTSTSSNNLRNICYPSVQRKEDGVALDVSVDDTLGVEVGQGLKDALTHRRYLLLVQPEDHRKSREVCNNSDTH